MALSIPILFASLIQLGMFLLSMSKIHLLNFNRGFAVGWDYAISWLIVLPFELIAAGLTINFWRDDINIGVWITVFLVILATIQIFGVRGYGEGELSEP